MDSGKNECQQMFRTLLRFQHDPRITDTAWIHELQEASRCKNANTLRKAYEERMAETVGAPAMARIDACEPTVTDERYAHDAVAAFPRAALRASLSWPNWCAFVVERTVDVVETQVVHRLLHRGRADGTGTG